MRVLNEWLGCWIPSQEFLKKKNNSILRIYRPSVHTVASHWFCAMENTVSFGDAVPIQNAVLHARLNSLSICCTRGFSFYNLHPLVIPSHTSISFFNNQHWVKERNIHLSKYAFQTGSAGGQASFFQKFFKICPGRILYNTKRPQRDSVCVVLHADDFVLEINVDDRT